MNIYEVITQKIIEELSKGEIPWKKTWSLGIPKSLKTKKPYRGINILLLGLTSFKSQYWVTFNECKNLGGKIKKGEKGSTIIYWHWRTEEELLSLKDQGKENSSACFPRLYTLFNVEQCEGLLIPEDDFSCSNNAPIQSAESVVENYKNKPVIAHALNSSPCYQFKADRVEMPQMSQFIIANQYYSTLFHELVHSTAHPSRLGRPIVDYRSLEVKTYSFEELVAELGAAFLCAQSGIEDQNSIENKAAYLSCWIKYLESDSSAILRASAEAQKAVDYMLGVYLSKTLKLLFGLGAG